MTTTTPDPLIIGGQPIVIGRIVHHVLDSPAAERVVCVASFVAGVNDAGSLQLVRLDNADRSMAIPWEPSGTVPRTWHWPNADRRQCQGRS